MDISVLGEWNPWWTEKTVPEEFIGKRRREYSSISESLNLPEVTIITGVRRSGKSTLMYQMIDGLLKKELVPEQILLANFEDPKIAATTLEELYEAYRTRINPDRKAYVFFDEVHKKEGWEKWIRKQYDLKKERLEEVSRELEDPAVWQKPEKAQELGKERSRLAGEIESVLNAPKPKKK